MSLAEKVTLITGAGNGIGRATAVRFATDGARVILFDVDADGLAETTQAVTAVGGEAVSVTGSVTDRADVQGVVETAVNQYGRLDILINNAGITRDGLTTRLKNDAPQLMSDEKWDTVLDINLKGTWLCSQLAAIPMIQQKSGKIINTSSVGALGNVGQANYAASKAGVMGLTRTFALEWARYGIAVNCVAPGIIDTPKAGTLPEKVRERLIKLTPMRRMGQIEDIANAVHFFASDQSGYVTRQVLHVSGGMEGF